MLTVMVSQENVSSACGYIVFWSIEAAVCCFLISINYLLVLISN